MAFLPFEERSLDVWIINFIKSIYSPTHYLWKASAQMPDYMSFKPNQTQAPKTMPTQMRSQLIQPYLQSIRGKPQNNLDVYEQNRIGKISGLFSGPSMIPTTPNSTTPAPRLPQNFPAQNPQPTQRPGNNYSQAATMNNMNPNPNPNITQQQSVPAQTNIAPPDNRTTINVQQQTLVPNPGYTHTSSQPTNPQPIITSAPPIGAPLQIKSTRPESPKAYRPTNETAYFSEDQMPPTPDLPNTLVGMVMTPSGQLLSDVILEIRDAENLPVRAIKTNRLGQFFIATPLRDGFYTLSAEHDSHHFDTIKIEVNGNIIAPLKLVSKIV